MIGQVQSSYLKQLATTSANNPQVLFQCLSLCGGVSSVSSRVIAKVEFFNSFRSMLSVFLFKIRATPYVVSWCLIIFFFSNSYFFIIKYQLYAICDCDTGGQVVLSLQVLYNGGDGSPIRWVIEFVDHTLNFRWFSCLVFL